jgi:murein DD-endopeptidase MepM/ murein hydrolase activator NlpD
LNKISKSRRTWLNFVITLQRKTLVFKKGWRRLFKSGRQFLAPKYWIVYLVSFALGFYLYGPAQGIKKIRFIHPGSTQKTGKPITIETLQRELENLKKEIRTVRIEKKVEAFTPDLFSRPALGQVIQGFDWVAIGNSWRLHPGVDIGLSPGSNVMAAAAGTISGIKELPSQGLSVTIDHGNGWESVYSGLTKTLVLEGQKVIKGVVVGESGALGCTSQSPSFHFGIFHDQKPADPGKIIDGLVK